ncbi:MAG: hypothetical protein FJ291_03925 [Planctomycetes bacterium]|nr:hypothetical protein [Planctomycetota bacterium]
MADPAKKGDNRRHQKRKAQPLMGWQDGQPDAKQQKEQRENDRCALPRVARACPPEHPPGFQSWGLSLMLICHFTRSLEDGPVHDEYTARVLGVKEEEGP